MAGLIEAFARGWVDARDRHAGAGMNYGPATEPASDGLAELAEAKARLADLVGEHERLEVRAALFSVVLQHPGVRRLLLGAIHPDRHANASDADRREMDELAAKINTAYDVLKGDEA